MNRCHSMNASIYNSLWAMLNVFDSPLLTINNRNFHLVSSHRSVPPKEFVQLPCCRRDEGAGLVSSPFLTCVIWCYRARLSRDTLLRSTHGIICQGRALQAFITQGFLFFAEYLNQRKLSIAKNQLF